MNPSRKFRAYCIIPLQTPKDRAIEYKQKIILTNLTAGESLKKNQTKQNKNQTNKQTKPHKKPQKNQTKQKKTNKNKTKQKNNPPKCGSKLRNGTRGEKRFGNCYMNRSNTKSITCKHPELVGHKPAVAQKSCKQISSN